MKKVLIICPYPTGLAPSQRFRFEQYLSHLKKNGFHAVIEPFFSDKAYLALYRSRKILPKIRAIIESYLRRLALLLHASSFDLVFIHRESTPAGPPFVEWFLAKILKTKIIYDFDDAIWLTDKTDESQLEKLFRWRRKVRAICKWSYRVSCGNDYLGSYARKYNSRITIIPTTIDTNDVHKIAASSRSQSNKIIIGWTGSHSTLKYLQMIMPVLKSLETKYKNIETLVIADRNPHLPLESFTFRPWHKASEISDLAMIDIGIMPLPDDEWTRGKCGFKALQYLALEIPAVVSHVGVNSVIIHHGKDGFLCDNLQDWFICLEKLILDRDLRKQMGTYGRQQVMCHYSVEANADKFLSLFQ